MDLEVTVRDTSCGIDVETTDNVAEITRTDYDNILSMGTKSFAEQFVDSLAGDCLKVQNDFDEAFAYIFLEVVAEEQSRTSKELSENRCLFVIIIWMNQAVLTM